MFPGLQDIRSVSGTVGKYANKNNYTEWHEWYRIKIRTNHDIWNDDPRYNSASNEYTSMGLAQARPNDNKRYRIKITTKYNDDPWYKHNTQQPLNTLV